MNQSIIINHRSSINQSINQSKTALAIFSYSPTKSINNAGR